MDPEHQQENIKYPKSVVFIISNEFCERFSYYGMRTILFLYLTKVLLYDDDTATVVYHVFTMFCYFFPLFGSMIADSWLGKFRTILYLSIVYALGNIVISVASASGAIDVPARFMSILGLLLIAIGTGGIKPCVSAFGGDQFILPQQEKQMTQFFSFFYFAINSGSLISTFLTPVLREDVKCLNMETCYPLAFGIPAGLMIISILIFVAGKNSYIIKKPQGNVVLHVCKCMSHAVGRKMKVKDEKRDHWLDYADDKYEKREIEDIKAALSVLYLYLPLPFFWALFDQQGSRWTYQATRMTGKLGDWSLKADQMQVVNPLLILLFIPIFETIIYPLFKKCNLLTKPLQRLGVGGVLAALAFIISAIVELQLQPSYAVLPSSGEGQLRIYNGFPCAIKVAVNGEESTELDYINVWKEQHISITGYNTVLQVRMVDLCTKRNYMHRLQAFENEATSYLVSKGKSLSFRHDDLEKNDGKAKLRFMFLGFEKNTDLYLINGNDQYHFPVNKSLSGSDDYTDMQPETYAISIDSNSKPIGQNLDLKLGGVYTVMVYKNDSTYDINTIEDTPPNNIHMLWLIPQYVVITMGEVMFSITGLEFSYSQAPVSMKSVMQAGWLLTVAFGNLIVVIIAEAKFFDKQLYEFILFAGLMLLDMLVFSLMAMGYEYRETPCGDGNDMQLEPNKEKAGIENKNFKGDES